MSAIKNSIDWDRWEEEQDAAFDDSVYGPDLNIPTLTLRVERGVLEARQLSRKTTKDRWDGLEAPQENEYSEPR